MTSIRFFVFFLLSFSLQDIHSSGYSAVTGVPLSLFKDEYQNEAEEPGYIILPLEEEIPTTYESRTTEEMEEETNQIWRYSPISIETEFLKEPEERGNTEGMQSGEITTESQPESENLEEDSQFLSKIPNFRDLTESEEALYRLLNEPSDISENSIDSLPQLEDNISPESGEVENVERVQSEDSETKSEPVAEDSNDFSTTSIDKELTELEESIERLLNELSATESGIAENSIDSAPQPEDDTSPESAEVENVERVQSGETKTESEPESQLKDEDSNHLPSSIGDDKTTTSITSTEISCQDDKKPVKQEKRYALAVFFKTNWFRAYQYCKYHGMQLATINSQEEELVLESTLGKVGYDLRDIWTSGTDKGEEGNFNWMSTGTPFTYTNWYQGEPNGRNRENCVAVFRATEGYFWNDALCDNEYYFACEYYTAEKTDAPTFV